MVQKDNAINNVEKKNLAIRLSVFWLELVNDKSTLFAVFLQYLFKLKVIEFFQIVMLELS